VAGVRVRHPLVALVHRLLVAQAAATGAIGLAYLRRNVTGLLFVLMLAVALCCLAGLVRSGTHAAWVIAVVFEGAFTLAGLWRVLASAGYLGGLLLAMATLGVLLHPAVGRAFAAIPGRGQPGVRDVRVGEQTLAENTGGAIGGGAG
jgi:hypothetical protein